MLRSCVLGKESQPDQVKCYLETEMQELFSSHYLEEIRRRT